MCHMPQLRGKQMRINTILEDLHREFVFYEEKIDTWSIGTGGDCDDFAVTLAWRLADEDLLNFLWGILTKEFTFIYVRAAGTGEPHLVLEYGGLCADNLMPGWYPRRDMPHTNPREALRIQVLLKLFLGLFL